MPELTIRLPNGATLRCGEGEEYAWGGSVRICASDGSELLYWTAQEWADEPEQVMGAIFAAASDYGGETGGLHNRRNAGTARR